MSDRQTGATVPRPIGVGAPAWIHLHLFGDVCREAFASPVYLVGSALSKKRPRDVDVVVQMRDGLYMALIGEVFEFNQPNTRWAAMSMAFSALGKQMTGRPIDFKIQFMGYWLNHKDEPRILLGRKGAKMASEEAVRAAFNAFYAEGTPFTEIECAIFGQVADAVLSSAVPPGQVIGPAQRFLSDGEVAISGIDLRRLRNGYEEAPDFDDDEDTEDEYHWFLARIDDLLARVSGTEDGDGGHG